MRKMSIPLALSLFPVAGIPRNSPWWVPLIDIPACDYVSLSAWFFNTDINIGETPMNHLYVFYKFF